MRRKLVLLRVREHWRVSERRACRILDVNRPTLQYRSKRVDDPALRASIKQIATVRVRYGYRRIHVLLRRDGWKVNHKRVHRICREEGLAICTKTPHRRRAAIIRQPRLIPTVFRPGGRVDVIRTPSGR